MHDLSKFNTKTFIAAIDALLADKQAELSVPFNYLISHFTGSQLEAIYEKHTPKKATTGDYIGAMVPLFAPGAGLLAFLGPLLAHNINNASYQRTKAAVIALAQQFTVRRPVISLTDQERALLRAYAALTAQKLLTPEQWVDFYAMLCWGDGKFRKLTIALCAPVRK